MQISKNNNDYAPSQLCHIRTTLQYLYAREKAAETTDCQATDERRDRDLLRVDSCLLPLNHPISFSPGTYTVVAGDEWGNLVLSYFVVNASPYTDSTHETNLMTLLMQS